MSMRVATFAMNDRMLSASLRTQARMAEMQMQEATGHKATSYGGLGATSKTLVDLEVSLTRSQSYAAAASEAGGRIEIMYSTLDTINDVLADFRSAITAMKSTNASDETRSALSSTAQTYMDELAILLNTQYEGRYLFAGSATTTKPVDLSLYPEGDADSATTAYYLGNDTLTAVQVSAQQSVTYGVTADNPAFEKAFRALSSIASTDGDFDDTDLDAALELIVEAIDGAAGVQGTLSVNAATLERASAREADYQSFLATSISNVRDVDVTEIAVKLTSYEVQLQAAYSALAKIQSLNLSDYLK